MRIVSLSVAFALAALLGLGSCSKSDAAGDMAGKAKEAAGAASDAMKDLDLTKLSGTALTDKAKTIVADLTTQLGALKDSAGAKDLVAKFGPAVDQLVKAKDALMAQKFDMSALTKAVSDVTTKFSANKDVMAVLQPFLDKLKSLTA